VSDLIAPVSLAVLAAGVFLALAGTIAVLPRALRVRRRALAVRASARAARADAERALALLAAQQAETEELLAPWRRLARWARHPLVVATLEWYVRRRRARALT
jgi:hypothetical protein